MHGAPAVSYPVGRCRLALWLLAGAWLAGAAACGAWAWQVEAPAWQGASAAGLLVVAGAAALRSALGAPQGTLAWTGASWRWQSGGQEQAGTPTRALDLQRWLLLHWTADAGGAAWFWLEQRRAPADWSALRRAVYSRARPGADNADETAPASSRGRES